MRWHFLADEQMSFLERLLRQRPVDVEAVRREAYRRLHPDADEKEISAHLKAPHTVVIVQGKEGEQNL
jgi:hypothetical protein